MGRRKSQDGAWDMAQTDNLFDAMVAKRQDQSGDRRIFTGSEAEERTVGLLLPALCLRYLFQSNVLPLGRTTVIIGKQFSCKSALLYEMFRWHREAMGFAVLLETEHKDSPELRFSMTNYDAKAAAYESCDTTNAWMEAAGKHIKLFQDLCNGTKSKPGFGRRAPMALGVDSLTATIATETATKFDKDGSPGRRFAIEAGMLADWFRHMPSKIYGWPISMIFTNHNKPITDQNTGRQVSHTPGGAGPKFNATYEIEMQHFANIKKADYEGRRLGMKMVKNSLGPGNRQIDVTMRWHDVFTDEGVAVQRTLWDWHTCSIDLLLMLLSKGFRAQVERIQNAVDLHVKSAGGKKVWSEALGIPSEAPVSFRKAGKMLEERPDILKQLHAAIGVRERYVFQPGVEFLDQMEEARQQAKERADLVKPFITSALEAELADDDLDGPDEGGDE